MCPIMPLPFVTYLTATDFESVANLIASPDVWLHSPTTPGLALSFVTPSGRRGMNFAVPVKSKGGKTAAVAMLYVDLARLQEAVAAESKNFRTSELFICAYVGGAPFIIAGANADGAMEPAFMGILAKTIEGAKISPDYKDSGYSLARDYKGNKVVAARDYLPQLDW